MTSVQPMKPYAVMRLRGRNDEDERQHDKIAAKMRLQNRYRKFESMKKTECKKPYQMMFSEIRTL